MGTHNELSLLCVAKNENFNSFGCYLFCGNDEDIENKYLSAELHQSSFMGLVIIMGL
jgi:hypothetical protein